MKYSIDAYRGKTFTDEEDIIFFYSHKPSSKGLTKACFSQWWVPCEFEENGIRFNCAEQYMMYQKAVVFKDQATAEKILKATEQKDIKALGRLVRNFNPKTWNAVKTDIVTQGNVLKFSQNPELKEFLLATGDKVLVEASPYDKIWGIGLRAHECDVNKWQGTNLLGFCLMEARDRIREERFNSSDGGFVPSDDGPKKQEERKEEIVEEIKKSSVLPFESYKAIDAKVVNGIKNHDTYNIADKTDDELCLIAQEKNTADSKEKKAEARNYLIAKNNHFINYHVNKVESKFFGKVSFDREELYQAGRCGLNDAIDNYDPNYDPEKKASFLTYAANYVRKYIYQAVTDYFSKIHIPENITKAKKKIDDLKNRGAYVKKDEVMKEAIQAGIVKDEEEYRYVKMVTSINKMQSFDEPLSDEEDSETLRDTVSTFENSGISTPEEELERAELVNRVREQLDKLPKDQQDVLRLVYGLNEENKRYSVDETRKMLGISRKQVRDAITSGLNALRVELLAAFLKD